ncbi:MAG: hypothetical protein ABIH26_14450 [Candidatus Eisenbacteria bacterium]
MALVSVVLAGGCLLAACGGCSEDDGPVAFDPAETGSGAAPWEEQAPEEGPKDLTAGFQGGTPGRACAPNAYRAVGEVLVVNNKHGEHRLVKGDKYEQCVGTWKGGFPVWWDWHAETDQPYVKGFPQVFFGINPWSGLTSTDRLPVRVGDIRWLTVKHDVVLSADGIYNLAYDLWLTEDDTPTGNEITHEIMIWLDGNTPPGLPRQREVRFGGVTYGFYRGVCEDGAPFLLFVADEPRPKGWVNLAGFLRFLAANDLVPLDVYLASIELGTEMWYGSGSAAVRKFKVSLLAD